MERNKKATSIIEAMIVLLILVTWIVWMFRVFTSSQKLSTSTTNKIQAIQIAKEWIEAIKNIRDTNWLLYWADYTNCWNTNDYNPLCVWNTSTTHDIAEWSYKIYQENDKRWKLIPKATGALFNSTYRWAFQVFVDWEWFYTQSWSTAITSPIFTREIQIEYLEDWKTAWDQWSNEEKMEVTSLVQWVDSSSDSTHKVELSSILTNWKK